MEDFLIATIETMILGIDEVGRGPWAGPLVVGAVVLGCEIDGLTDSKKLSKKRRNELAVEIHDKAQAVGLGWVHADEIDELGLATALVEATKRAVSEIKVPYHEIIIDGTINFLAATGKGQYVTTMKKADLLIPSVSAASIVAKVARDTYMEEMAERHPNYGFEKHVGYGTATHRAAIDVHGITPLHRLSFAPLAKYHNVVVAEPVSVKTVTTKQIGDRAEEVAAKYLQELGYEILERNWKTKFCEIDIVAAKDDIVYFVEVKHRRYAKQGGGIAAITPKKLQKMTFAAKVYVKTKNLADSNLQLAVTTTLGDPPELEQYLAID